MIGEVERVIFTVVGDTQRLELDGLIGQGIRQEVPATVQDAYGRLIAVGYDRRVLTAEILVALFENADDSSRWAAGKP